MPSARTRNRSEELIEWLEGEALKLRHVGGSDPYDLYGGAREAAEKIREVIARIEALQSVAAAAMRVVMTPEASPSSSSDRHYLRTKLEALDG